DIARRLWSALTPALVPTSPEQRGEPAITITGPRPGERLAEPLTAADETLEHLPLPGLLRVRGIRCPAPEAVEEAVQRVAALLEGDASPAALREALFRPI
ncbi:MAG: hypothetical protein M3442_01055, partial [Chloroflexota bacterium]|nr:hypothetical protein [Chloroflexota bacterium]